MRPGGDQGELVVPIVLNGVEKKFLFDTGGGTANYISSRLARELKLVPFHSGASMDMRGNVSDSAVIVKEVAFGAIKAGNVPFQIASDIGFDGIVSAGSGALSALNLANVDLDMDFGAMKLNFFSSDHCPGDVVYWPHRVLAVVPVAPRGGHIEVAASLDSHPLTATIDTGTPWTIVNRAWAEENVGFSPQTAAQPPPGIPLSDPDKGIYFRKYFALFFPGVTVTDPLVIIRPVQFAAANGRAVVAGRARRLLADVSPQSPDMIVGMEVLKHLHIYYAVDEQKLYLTPAASDQSLSWKDGMPSSSDPAPPR
jgi:predicted aspartyl protease